MIRLNGIRGVALLAGALYCAVRGIAYLPLSDVPAELPAGLQLLSARIPIGAWACVWLLVALVCLLFAFTARGNRPVLYAIANRHHAPRPRLSAFRDDALAWGLLVAMMAAWAIAYTFGWVTSFWAPDGISREWLNASTYGLPAVMLGLLSSRLVAVREDDADAGAL